MPIVNGSYVQDSLTDARTAQQQVFGDYSRRDMSDYSAAAYNYLMRQQEQAYNLELWKLTNEYNSPAAQMARFQDAGLNPNLIYGQQNTAQSPQGASAASFRPNGAMSKGVQQGMNAIGQILQTVRAARETYDYLKYGRQNSALQNDLTYWRTLLTSGQETAQGLANDWQKFLQGRMDLDPTAPGVKTYQTQQQAKSQYIEYLKEMIKNFVPQRQRTAALTALDEYKKSMMEGQNDFILHGFDTGNDTLNAFLRTMMYFGFSNAF